MADVKQVLDMQYMSITIHRVVKASMPLSESLLHTQYIQYFKGILSLWPLSSQTS